MSIEQRITDIIQPAVEDMGFDLVRVVLSGQQRVKLQIMAERSDGSDMDVEDCADLSRAVSAILDVDDPVKGAYTLEVSSPGIDRPLVKPADFERFAGFEARLETHRPIDGRRRFKGRLLGFEEGAARIDLDEGGVAALPFEDIQKAKLLLTDELIQAHQDKAKEDEDD